ncbi:interleukin-15 receptor subunit alpha isoform X2 [Antechinus flavipes]|uniref:interleukin-15 receptor subunit alpha isoform X2 n=1 Tax=Antechinus flavipes TaxID=38775 RepID=UPI002236578D|nr:interleukin-15 receptor subunit alpha isoform X2 [Antechinus flavipes]
MAKCSQVLRCRLIALPLLWLQLLPLLPLCALREVTCPTPKSVENADIKVKSHSIESRERYVCNSGFKRQAGTSNLIQCILDQKSNTARWTETNLKCIRDPTLVHLQTSSPTMSTRKLPIPGKGFTVEPEASKSSTTVTTETIMMSASISLPSSIHTESPTLAEKQYSVISSISVIIISLIVILVYFICRWYTRRRNPVPEVSVGTEEIPMTGGIDREEDVGS